MQKIFKDTATIKELLIRVQKHIQRNQRQLFLEFGGSENLKKDSRILSFGYQRMIVFCAINDCENFKNNLISKSYLKVSDSLGEVMTDDLMIQGLINYPVYNYILRYCSIIEMGTRSFVPINRFKEYENCLGSELRTASRVLREWRNTIHKNGILDGPIDFIYRGKKLEIRTDKPFEFDYWDLFKISKDCSDYVAEFARMNFKIEKGYNIG